jgi:hypothetical protein
MEWEKAEKHVELIEETLRPFRLWNPSAEGDLKHSGAFVAHRYYSHLRNAHLSALIECRWAKVGVTIEVIDVRTGKFWGSYTRRVDDIRFIGGDHIPTKLA